MRLKSLLEISKPFSLINPQKTLEEMPTTLNSIMAETQNTTVGGGGGGEVERGKGRAAAAAGFVVEAMEEPPTRPEVMGWYVYGLCSYFVQVFLLPVLFPLLVAQRAVPAPLPPGFAAEAGACAHRNGTVLYQMLIHRSITMSHSKVSPLHWTAISWFAGVLISAPILPKLAQHLDHSYHQPLIIGLGTSIGAFICLLTGFFRTVYLFPIYIVIITIAVTAASSVHTRHLALIVRGTHQKSIVSSQMSLTATALGSFGTAVIALFTYHMLRRTDHLTSLWVVFIFSGLKWFLGFTETFFANRVSSSAAITRVSDYWPRFVGRLSGVFLSSFSSTCIFTSATLYIVGSLCIRPTLFLSIWIVYFIFSSLALPALHPIQLLVRADPVKMSLLGFILSAVVSGSGFYFKNDKWHFAPIMVVAIVQSCGSGIMTAFGKVMVLDRAPPGKEGVFATWYEWVKMSGACAGFALAAVCPDDIQKTFGFSFMAVVLGVIVLIFGSEARKGQSEKEIDGGSSENGLGKGEQRQGKQEGINVQV